MINVLLVTTWETACGIAEHSAYLKEAVEAADPAIAIRPTPEALDPIGLNGLAVPVDIVHLNYQAALHSRWTPDEIRKVQGVGVKVVVTYHDTGVPNSDQCKAIVDAADAAVVHESFDDLPEEKTRYWRMGVPARMSAMQFGARSGPAPSYPNDLCFKSWIDQPILGSVGFPFPWKNYDKLAEITAAVGWALCLLAPTATREQVLRWQAINPDTYVQPSFLHRRTVGNYLAACDATAFCYTCANTGQSGAVLQGIAARKPVIALHTCRQMRALFLDRLGGEAIRWASTFDEVGERLRWLSLGRVDSPMVALAEQESWTRLGAKYAALYRELVA